MTKVVLLRIGDRGEPVVANSHKGVLTFPACPPNLDAPEDAPLFTLRFYIVSGSKICNDGKIWTNVRNNYHDEFDRFKFTSHDIETSIYKDVKLDIKIFSPGSYSYYVTYSDLNAQEEEVEKVSETYNFVVPPSLFINNKYLTFNSISMQSVVSKWVGNDFREYKG